MDHSDVEQLGLLAGHGREAQDRFYDNMREKLGGAFVQAHGGFLQTAETLAEAEAYREKGENCVWYFGSTRRNHRVTQWCSKKSRQRYTFVC